MEAPISVFSPNQPRLTTVNRAENRSDPSHPKLLRATTSAVSAPAGHLGEQPAGITRSGTRRGSPDQVAEPVVKEQRSDQRCGRRRGAISHTMNSRPDVIVRWSSGPAPPRRFRCRRRRAGAASVRSWGGGEMRCLAWPWCGPFHETCAAVWPSVGDPDLRQADRRRRGSKGALGSPARTSRARRARVLTAAGLVAGASQDPAIT